MRRSVENAEHVGKASLLSRLTSDCPLTACFAGLFAPRAGQNFRDEQRRRRSQYDRGTRLAEIEDNYRVNHQFHGVDPGYGYQSAPLANRFHYVGRSTF